MFRNSLFLLFAIFIFSCDSKKSEQEHLYKEIISTHDEVMPKMEDVAGLSKKLKEKVKEVSDSEKLNRLKTSIVELEDASSSMMDWMRKFNPSYDTLPEKAALDYLKEEQLKIEQIKTKINRAIEEGNKQI